MSTGTQVMMRAPPTLMIRVSQAAVATSRMRKKRMVRFGLGRHH